MTKRGKAVFIFSITFLWCMASLMGGLGMAQESVIKRTSGNLVKVQYEGAIKGVSFHGSGDAIAGIVMPSATGETAKAVSHAAEQRASEAKDSVETGDESPKKKGWFKLRWAKPVDDY